MKKFNILEDIYKERRKREKLKKKRLKNRILRKSWSNSSKNENILENQNKKDNGSESINEENINTSNKFKEDSINEDDSKTIHESFEMHRKAFDMLDKNLNNINNNDKMSYKTISNKKEKKEDKNYHKKKKSLKSFKSKRKKECFKPNEKIQYKTYENVNSSLNEMINIDLLNETHNSDERNNTNIFRYNLFSSNNRSFFDKGSMTTQSN